MSSKYYDSKSVLRHNIQARLASHPTLTSPARLAAQCFWPRGKKKGSRIAQRTIGYVFDVSDLSPSPTLDVIEAIARALDVHIWQLLTDTEEARRTFVELILAAPAVPDPAPAPTARKHRAKH